MVTVDYNYNHNGFPSDGYSNNLYATGQSKTDLIFISLTVGNLNIENTKLGGERCCKARDVLQTSGARTTDDYYRIK